MHLDLSSNQIAFVPKWSISENVLLAQEVVRGYHKRVWGGPGGGGGGLPRSTIKVDIMKAYDLVNWKLFCNV
jgi:hypothetical protein